ncbi:MAG: MFS transporter [Opitutales bacterium]|nr:MFS transporter [Opitutales bacterium]
MRRSGVTLAGGLWLTQFALTTQALVVVAWMPWLAEDLGVSFSVGAGIVSLYAVILAVGALVGGVLNDFAGPRRVVSVGVVVAGGGLALHPFVGCFESFVAVRVLTGCGHALVGGGLLALMSRRFRLSGGRTFGWIMSGGGAGQTFGVACGLLLANRGAGWMVFAVCGGLLGIAFLRLFFDVWVDRRKPSPGGIRGWLGQMRESLRGVGGFSFAWQGSVAQFLMYAGSALLVVFFPAWWTLSAGLGAGGLAIVLFMGGFIQMLCTAGGGALAARFRATEVVRVSLWVSGVLLLLGSVFQWFPFMWMTSIYLLGVATMSLRLSPVQVVVSGAVPRRDAGSWLGLQAAMGQAGRAGGSALGALMFAPGGMPVIAITGALAFLLSEHAFSKAYGR